MFSSKKSVAGEMMRAVDHFRVGRNSETDEELERRKWFIAAKEQRERRDALDQNADEALLDLVVAAALADPANILQFQAKLDVYDEATVKALMENQELLDAFQERINGLLDRAHVIEDGRRVFKTRDGTQVYDEHGVELSEEVVDPNQISNGRPYWEDYEAVREQERALRNDRNQILEFQEKLDHARERADASDLTQNELDELEADLEDSIPPSVANHVPGFEQATDPQLKDAFAAKSANTFVSKIQVAPIQAPSL